MAVRYREGRTAPWQTYWNNPFTGKREAENFATEAEARKHDSLIKHRLKYERESFRAGEPALVQNEDLPQSVTLEMCHLAYLRQKQFTKKSVEWQMSAMVPILKRIGTMPVNEITKSLLEGIMQDMGKEQIKPTTVRSRFSVLRTVLRWSADRELCQPVQFPKLPPAKYERFIPPTPEELDQILQVAPDHIKRVILIGSQLGARVGPSELLKLTWHDVNLFTGLVRIHGSKKNLDSPWREVPIRADLLPIFKDWQAEDAAQGFEFLIHYRGKQITSIKRAWKTTLLAAGITRRIRPYDLRHAFATEMIAGGVDIGTVANLMGHSTPAMLLKHYQFVMDKQKKAAVEALPKLQVGISPCATLNVPKNKGATDFSVTP